MELVTPDPGLLFWMTITFLLVLFILTKFAWKPIMKALKDRESSIEEAIQSAENARRQMDSLKADNEKLLQEARLERDKMMKEAKEMKESIISQARKSADEEGRKMIAAAKEAIDKEKMAALAEVKNQVATLAVDIAEKILKREIKSNTEQESLIKEYLNLN
jgi:F-type H+-transporting ATPase subunit b